jgi:uncharacterized protein (TIGR02145 family)
LIYTITGTPSGSGTASFALNIGGRSCTITRVVNQNIGFISNLACSSATNTGALTQGVSAAGVSSSVPYSGGNGGSHSGQSVNSTGVQGLVATLSSGSFTASTGSLTYIISGTPSGSGTASFALNIGGRACTLTRTVAASSGTSNYPPGTYCANLQSSIFEVTTITGRTWMDRNLGASKSAASSSDSGSFGDLYQWGRRSDGHQCRNASITTTLSSSNNTPANSAFIIAPSTPNDWRNPQNSSLWQGVSGTNNPCPSGYRLPTATEFNAELQSWTNKNSSGAISSPLRLPTAGYREFADGTIESGIGSYWTSTVDNANSSVSFDFDGSSAAFYNSGRAYGSSVRCIKN